jgi:hypothetical protein
MVQRWRPKFDRETSVFLGLGPSCRHSVNNSPVAVAASELPDVTIDEKVMNVDRRRDQQNALDCPKPQRLKTERNAVEQRVAKCQAHQVEACDRPDPLRD